jgi:hypothetical protein
MSSINLTMTLFIVRSIFFLLKLNLLIINKIVLINFMSRNQIYMILQQNNIINDLCNIIISYVPHKEYDLLIREYKVLIHFYGNSYIYIKSQMYKVIPHILEVHRISKKRRLL